MTLPFLAAGVLESHVGILGKTGSGKSNLAKVIVEGLLDDGQRVCVIDPTGTWYGLRLNRDRTPSRFPVVMFGGNHADIAIGRTHGVAVAETIGTTDTPAVIDTRTMTVGERTEFFTAFAETLLQRNRGPLHLVVDEAHLFAPQGRVADPKSGAMVHAANNLVSLGRGIGLRIILISQRPAKLHKDSLTQVETLIALRLIAPQDRNAIGAWIEEWAGKGQGTEVLASLPSLATGSGWIWAPGEQLLERFDAPLAGTLDTGRPSDEPIALTPIDVAAVRERLGQADTEAKSNNPAELKREISRLTRELDIALRGGRITNTVEVEKIVEVPVLTLEDHALLRQVQARLDTIAGGIEVVTAEGKHFSPLAPVATATARPTRRSAPTRAAPAPDAPLSQAILSALVDAPEGRSLRQIGILVGYAANGGFFRRTLVALREQGLIEGDMPRLTDAGREQAGDPIAMGAPLLAAWMQNQRLGHAAASFLPFLADAHPDALSIAELADRAGYNANGGYFRRSLKKLRDLNLVASVGASAVVLSNELAYGGGR